jgi:acyl-CoA thioester hydrolase
MSCHHACHRVNIESRLNQFQLKRSDCISRTLSLVMSGGVVVDRVKISAPEQFLFTMERVVGISDLNYARHIDSVSMMKLLHEARLQFLASLGFTEANVYGLGIVVTDLAVDFRSESFANDHLIIDVGVSKFNKYGFDIGFQVTNSALETVVCNAKMGVVFFDFDKHKLAEVPRAFKSILAAPASQVA